MGNHPWVPALAVAAMALLLGCTDGDVNVSKTSSSSGGGSGSADSTAPGEVDGLTAAPGSGSVTLSWANPSDADLAGVIVRRRTDQTPTDETDGLSIYDGTGTSTTETGLVAGRYYYAVFTYDDSGNVSAGDAVDALALPVGQLNASFGTGGVVLHDNAAGGNGDDVGNALVIQSDGKIVVTGVSTAGDDAMAIWRFTTAGVLDGGFNGGGPVIYNNFNGGAGMDAGYAVALNSTGDIRAVGTAIAAGTGLDATIFARSSSGAAQFLLVGASDTVLHDALTGYPTDTDIFRAMSMLANDRLYVCGYGWNGANHDFVLSRLDPLGSMDTGFNGGVPISIDSGFGGDFCHAVVAAPDGGVIAAGSVPNGINDDLYIVKYTSAGLPDPGFNAGGPLQIDSPADPGTFDTAYAIALDSQDRILVGGLLAGGATDVAFVLRLLPDGSLDTSFGTNGVTTVDVSSDGLFDDRVNSLAVDALDGVVAVGQTGLGSAADVLVFRLDNSGALDAGFGSGGILVLSDLNGEPDTDEAYGVALDAFGRILVTGASRGPTDSDLFLLRLE